MANVFDEYIRRGQYDPTRSGRETQDIKNALQAISSYESLRSQGKALGVDASAKPKKGIVSKVLGDVLGAPARAVRAGGLDLLGYDDPSLQGRSPFQSALAGARGDINITGGDIVRTSSLDNPLERAGKLGAAFLFDVATDPITYIGTPSVVGRKGAASLAMSKGVRDDALNSAIKLNAKNKKIDEAKSADEIINKIFARSEEGVKFSKGDPFTQDLVAKDITGEWKKEIASRHLGGIIGESLMAGGRQGIITRLDSLFGSGNGRIIFESLPDRIRGGLYLANPVTGRTIAPGLRTSGTGQSLGKAGEELNRMRRNVSEFTGRFTKNFSGERGEAYQLLRKDIKDYGLEVVDMPNRRMTLRKLADEKEISRLQKRVQSAMLRRSQSVLQEYQVERNLVSDKKSYDTALRLAMENRADDLMPTNLTPEQIASVRAIATKIKEETNAIRKELLEVGVEVGDLGENYIPIVATKEGSELFRNLRASIETRGGTRLRGDTVSYDPSKFRSSGAYVFDTPEQVAEIGLPLSEMVGLMTPYQLNLRVIGRQVENALVDRSDDNIRSFRAWLENKMRDGWIVPGTADELVAELKKNNFMTAPNFSKKLVLESIETDPTKSFYHYATSQSARVASARMIREGIRVGLFQPAKTTTVQSLSERNTAEFVERYASINKRVFKALNKQPKLRNAIKQLSNEQLASFGLLRPDKLSKIISNLQINRLLPNNALAVQEIDMFFNNIIRMRTMQNLSNAQVSSINNLVKNLADADSSISAIDELYNVLVNEMDLGPQSISRLISTVGESIDQESLALLPTLRNLAYEDVEMLRLALQQLKGADANIEEINYVLRSLADKRGLKTTKIDQILETIGRQIDESPELAKILETEKKDLLIETKILPESEKYLEAMGLKRIGAEPVVAGTVDIPRELSELRAVEGVRNLFEARHRVTAQPDQIQKFVEDVYDPAFMIWKMGATVTRGPGYTFLNMIGNLYLNFLGNVSAKDHSIAAKVMDSAWKASRQAAEELSQKGLQVTPSKAAVMVPDRVDEIMRGMLAGQKIRDRELFDLVKETMPEIMETTQISDTMRVLVNAGEAKNGIELSDALMRRQIFAEEASTRAGQTVQGVADWIVNNRFQQSINTVNTYVESWTRMAAVIDGYRVSGSIDEALERMYTLQFNYGDLGKGDLMARRFFPFYVWTRNNVPAQVRAMFVQPGKIRRFMAAQEEFKKTLEANGEESWLQEVLPEYVGEVGGFASSVQDRGMNLAFGGKLPYHDLDRLLQLSGKFELKPSINHRELAQMLGPFTVGLEAIFQRDFATGASFDPAGAEATGFRRGLSYIPGVGSVGKYGERRIPEFIEKSISDLLPIIGTGERVLTGAASLARMGGAEGVANILEMPASQRMRERGLSNLLNVTGISPLLGVSATTLTPRTISSSVRSRREDQLAAINQAAGRQGISAEWVAEMIRQGYTPEQVAVMITGGMGQLEQYEREQSRKAAENARKKRSSRKDMGAMLRGLGSPR